MRALVIALVLVGCRPPITVERLERAEVLVWGVYGQPRASMPTVVAHLQENCTDVYGNSGLWHATSRECLPGWYGARVEVLVLTDFASSVLAHEMYHAALAAMSPTHDGDDAHETAGWSVFVPAAESELRRTGL